MKLYFRAPWGMPLTLMTGACFVICVCLSLPGLAMVFGTGAFARGLSAIPFWAVILLTAVPLLTMLISAAFMVRGYVLTDGFLTIKRLGWETSLNLARLASATVDPNSPLGSIRLFGNGGFFAFSGWYRNKKLGVYHLYATDMKKAVVIRFSDKTVVISPDDPEKFVAAINSITRPGP